jgi:hypothetical protein
MEVRDRATLRAKLLRSEVRAACLERALGLE